MIHANSTCSRGLHQNLFRKGGAEMEETRERTVAAFFDREKNRRSSTKDYGDRWTDGERKSTSNGMMKRV